MKTLNKLIAATIAAASVGNAIALPDVGVINSRVSNILDKIGVDAAGFDAGDYSISGSNDLGDFSSNFTAASGSTAQDIADQINAFNVVNTTVYIPASVDSVNGVRSEGLEDLLLNALSFKINEITGDVGSLVSSFADGKLAFETALNSGVAIIAPASVDYSNADAQTWFGVKNSLDIFTASADAWTVGIRELNGDMDADGTRDTGRVSHFDADVVVGAEVADYDSDQDVTSDVGLVVSTFAADGTESSVFLDLGHSYDRDKLAAASVVAGSTTLSERNGILSGETIFSAARHENDTTGYSAAILSALDRASLTTTTTTVAVAARYTNTNSNWYMEQQSDGDWKTFNAAGVDQGYDKTTSEVATVLADNWTDNGKFITISSSNAAYDGMVLKWNAGSSVWAAIDNSFSFGIGTIDASGNVVTGGGTTITGATSIVTSLVMYTTTAEVAGSSITTLNAGALDSIKNSEISGYAAEFLTDTVDTSSPQWLQDLAGI